MHASSDDYLPEPHIAGFCSSPVIQHLNVHYLFLLKHVIHILHTFETRGG